MKKQKSKKDYHCRHSINPVIRASQNGKKMLKSESRINRCVLLESFKNAGAQERCFLSVKMRLCAVI